MAGIPKHVIAARIDQQVVVETPYERVVHALPSALRELALIDGQQLKVAADWLKTQSI